MEPIEAQNLKRIKTSTKTKDLQPEVNFKFELFFGDILDKKEHLRNKYCKDFYSLFNVSLTTSTKKQPNSQLESILFLTFSVSRELLQPLLEKKIPIVLASDCSTNIEHAIAIVDEEYSNFLKFFPRKKVFHFSCSSFHPKLILIKFASFLRVVIGSGNLLEEDWISWENVFIVRDYPLSYPRKSRLLSQQLEEYLSFTFDTKYDYTMSFMDLDLKSYDMTENEFYLLPSLPSRWKSDQTNNYGFSQLRKIMELNKPASPFTFDSIKVYYMTSSVGVLTSKLILDFCSCFVEELWAKQKPTFEEKEKLISKFNVLFPSQEFVEKSKFGVKSGSCLFLDKENFKSFKFIKSVFKVFSKKEGSELIIPHTKMFIVTNSETLFNDDTIIYIGSHNFTSAAWGRFEHDRENVFINNYEMGVVIPPLKNSTNAKRALIQQFELDFKMKEFDKNNEPYFTKK